MRSAHQFLALARAETYLVCEAVDITKAGQGAKGLYTERVVIQRIEYDDGSVWTRASN